MGDGSLAYDEWERLLPIDDADREWLLNGIKEGFNILNPQERADKIVEVENYSSATGDNKVIVEKQILVELNNNRYVFVQSQPKITSALGAIKKSSGGIRLIHDASRPEGLSLNDMWRKEPFSYTSLQDGVDLIKQGSYLAKVDLESAFRSVKIHPSNFDYTGLKWTFESEARPRFMIDTRLPFGARRSPYIFNSLTQAVCRIMKQRGYPGIIAYLDDFLVVKDTYQECKTVMNALMETLRKLGFSINYKKVEGPVQVISFLGVMLDSTRMTLSLPKEKICDLQNSLKNLLLKPKTTKRSLQGIAGKLNFAVQCIYGGRFFLQRIYDEIANLRKPWHRCRVTREVKADVDWWLRFLSTFNGTMEMVDSRPLTPIYTDACPVACGGVFRNEFVYLPFASWPEAEPLSINMKETLAVEVALRHWAPHLRNKKVLLHVDNQSAVYILNKGASKDKVVMESLRRLFWLSSTYNFRLMAVYYPGVENCYADAISRLHEGPRLCHKLNMEPVFLQQGTPGHAKPNWMHKFTGTSTIHTHQALSERTSAITDRTFSSVQNSVTRPFPQTQHFCHGTLRTCHVGCDIPPYDST